MECRYSLEMLYVGLVVDSFLFVSLEAYLGSKRVSIEIQYVFVLNAIQTLFLGVKVMPLWLRHDHDVYCERRLMHICLNAAL